MPQHTSQLFGTNIVHLLQLLTPGKDGELVLDLDDPVQRGMAVTHDGEVLWPPPPVAGVGGAGRGRRAHRRGAGRARRGRGARTRPADASGGRSSSPCWPSSCCSAISFAPAAFLGHFTVFVLAVIVGYYVISNVSHSLHTPLMAQTNAISGIILVGALLQIGDDSWLVTVLAVIAASVASINVFGGFLVANRMIRMFRKDA